MFAVLSTAPNFLSQLPFSGKNRYHLLGLSGSVSSNCVELMRVNCCPGTGTGLVHPPAVASPTINNSDGRPCCCVKGVTVYLPVWKSTVILYKPEVAGPGILSPPEV